MNLPYVVRYLLEPNHFAAFSRTRQTAQAQSRFNLPSSKRCVKTFHSSTRFNGVQSVEELTSNCRSAD